MRKPITDHWYDIAIGTSDAHSNYDQLMNEMIDKAVLFAKVFKKYI